MELMEDLLSVVDEKKFAVGVFLDLKKAFTIDHNVMLEKWKRMESEGWE